MKRVLLAFVAATCLSFGFHASAAPAPSQTTLPQPQAAAAPESDAIAARRQPLRNVWRSLLELERRKNAMLRRMLQA